MRQSSPARFIKTRCIDSEHDKACGNESAYFRRWPPASTFATATAAVEYGYRGNGLSETSTSTTGVALRGLIQLR